MQHQVQVRQDQGDEDSDHHLFGGEQVPGIGAGAHPEGEENPGVAAAQAGVQHPGTRPTTSHLLPAEPVQDFRGGEAHVLHRQRGEELVREVCGGEAPSQDHRGGCGHPEAGHCVRRDGEEHIPGSVTGL